MGAWVERVEGKVPRRLLERLEYSVPNSPRYWRLPCWDVLSKEMPVLILKGC